MSTSVEEPTVPELVEALNTLNDRQIALEAILVAPLGKQPDGQPPSVSVRLDALEKALQFAMSHVQVQITSQSPIIGGSGSTQQMSMLDFYMQSLKQQQMLVKNV